MSAILIDLGGTHLRCGIADASYRPLVLQKTRICNFVAGVKQSIIWDEVISAIAEFASGVRHRVSPSAPIVFSFPGPVAHDSTILDAPTVVGQAPEIPEMGSLLQDRTGRRVHILNDVSAAAWYVSEAISDDRFMVVTVSSGIGSKVFDRNHPARVFDDVPYAGEIGHVIVDDGPDALPCDCGGIGHLGAVSSGRGIERYARVAAARDFEDFSGSACVTRFGARGETLTNEEHLVPAARLGDRWAWAIIRQRTTPLARVLLSVVQAIGLQRVVVIGGFALSLGEDYREVLRQGMKEASGYRVIQKYVNDLVILGHEHAPLFGTATYARRMAQA